MKMATAVSIEKVGRNAEDNYRQGFFCSEAVMESIITNFELDIPEEVMAMASGFPAGIGRSGCVCGALAGATMASGLFFGRIKKGDPKVEKNLAIASELHDYFKGATGKNVVCCRILTRGFDMSKGEHKEQCINFTGMVARKFAEIIVREQNLMNMDEDVS